MVVSLPAVGSPWKILLPCVLQIKHAIRTYRSAVSVFEGTMWGHIKDNVHFRIGQWVIWTWCSHSFMSCGIFNVQKFIIKLIWFRWYAILGMYDLAVKHMLKVLACSHQSKTTQELFLREFLQIVQVIFILVIILYVFFFCSFLFC